MSPYAQWGNGPSSDPDYFPIGVWLQSPSNATRYQAAGINLYVGLWRGPTAEQLAALSAVGMRVICAQNEVGLAHADDPIIAAWMHGDEPDNAQRQADGSWGGAGADGGDHRRLPAHSRRGSDATGVAQFGAGGGQ